MRVEGGGADASSYLSFKRRLSAPEEVLAGLEDAIHRDVQDTPGHAEGFTRVARAGHAGECGADELVFGSPRTPGDVVRRSPHHHDRLLQGRGGVSRTAVVSHEHPASVDQREQVAGSKIGPVEMAPFCPFLYP